MRVVRKMRKPAQRVRVATVIVTAVVSAGVGFLVEDEPGLRLTAALVFGIVTAIACALIFFWPVEGRVRQAVKQQVGTEAPFIVEVWLVPEGLHYVQMDTHVLHKWDIVEDIEVDRGDVVFHIKHGNILVVRDRAFESDDIRTRFVDLANQHRTAPGATAE